MAKPKEVRVTTTVIRHHPQLARLVTVPLEKIAPWKLTTTTVVEGEINGSEIGRRSLKSWDERGCWWIDLPEPLCKKLKLETGDEVKLTIRIASADLPEELTQLLRTNTLANANWQKLTQAQQRMLREELFTAKTPETRLRRALKVLT